MIDFSPLFQTLKEKGIVINSMRDTVLSSRTITKINRNDIDGRFYLETIDKICLHLDVPIEKVVKIVRDK
jgi:DNA-binding Xre family transcriptional regulator